MPVFDMYAISRCFRGCHDHAGASRLGTRIWNLSDRPVELQVRVGSILKKGYTLKVGCSKRLNFKSIYKSYVPSTSSRGDASLGGMKSLLYYYDQTCHPYVWIHDCVGDFTRVVKQQYISLEDLRDFSEIRIFRDHQRGCIAVRMKPRPDFC
ncbi:hypothetical protein RJ641_004122 [Dillenia turbinata]|uniref:Uncharacterized protein n=1 Tax=Dillenia turbinata TaxID=194707 RepID=A0AAN8VLU2_9MAGN